MCGSSVVPVIPLVLCGFTSHRVLGCSRCVLEGFEEVLDCPRLGTLLKWVPYSGTDSNLVSTPGEHGGGEGRPRLGR